LCCVCVWVWGWGGGGGGGGGTQFTKRYHQTHLYPRSECVVRGRQRAVKLAEHEEQVEEAVVPYERLLARGEGVENSRDADSSAKLGLTLEYVSILSSEQQQRKHRQQRWRQRGGYVRWWK